MSIEIKEVSADFLDQFHACLDEVAKEEVYLLLTSVPPKERMKEFLKLNIENKVPQVFAFDGSKMVGWCDIRPFKHGAELGIGVIKSHRRKGIGKKLLSSCVEIAKARGVEIIFLEVFSDNRGAIKLYEDFGFEKEGLLKKYRKVNGRYQDSVCMSLFLV